MFPATMSTESLRLPPRPLRVLLRRPLPPLPAASKPRGPVRAPLQLVKRAPSVDSRKQGEGLQGDLAAQVARIAAERSRRLQNAASDGSSTPKAGAPNGGLALGVKRALDGSKPESKVSRFIGGSVGTGEENKENAEGYQRLLQQKLASRRKLVEEDVTGGSTATVNFD
ncbi:hypothetical protein KFL_004040050 [Klebsormidium nitens]|uniref:Uncharacterized protein n=1 Tax=Klebsormidium nitens TaxID=105231 RepID=A0A1Y1IB04_KLENI|nr:hypothetical protein KFL_004040050 [Klebsormidium nitens]|eukprot:GAQ88145.1 hypothetical protein KFL_004040050 [Klebsormidium nitens]